MSLSSVLTLHGALASHLRGPAVESLVILEDTDIEILIPEGKVNTTDCFRTNFRLQVRIRLGTPLAARRRRQFAKTATPPSKN